MNWFKTKDCLPPPGTTIVIIGQDNFIEKATFEKRGEDSWFSTYRIDRYRDCIGLNVNEVKYWSYLPQTINKICYGAGI